MGILEMKKGIFALLLSASMLFALTGCGEDSELEIYRKEVESFYADVIENL